ncbi:hypothetical protein M3215_18910 [Bacillus cytotoxicus]|uniref:Uncharacterized protein n=1 Tax=Bacillus cytotoxicus TaxID=580165 RepID=A0ACC6AC28_9BACI|nr:hypothetical protein [Bacillus cytotoxicus]
MKKKKLFELEKKWSEREMSQEFYDYLEAEEEKKKEKDGIIILSVMTIVLFSFVFALKGCDESSRELKMEKAAETVSECGDKMAALRGQLHGKKCDDARKIHYNYSEREWRAAKKKLIFIEEITEHDLLYDELKREIAEERDY